ncbi:MmcQ/YjbR family DNA-binding protein [Microbacterium sp. CIAB417]|uniref:MmcQ/YjbR family DNA-binding protein n=1 Tax=Microbacterium sp. CIAB417 TaxID=2860287 RepID=UPI001FAB81B4|nr:MmcQ/YjbR family DNA-binding protein [Microbacterium sp. CIAB417]
MDDEALLRIATARADELPGAGLEHPFGPEWDVFKVRGKVFMLQTHYAGRAMVTLKSHPEDAAALCETFADITPGYHMNKKHWISVSPGPSLEPGLVTELVTESYRLVVEKLPRAQRPVDPHVFGVGSPHQA